MCWEYILNRRLISTEMDAVREKVIADNIYILTVDGDVEFEPDAVHMLVDFLKKDPNIGAACGRIHPTGKGNRNLFHVTVL